MAATDKKNHNAYARFSTLGIQMGIVIGLATWLGVYLDERYPNKYKLYTVFGALLGVFIAMYLMIKEVKEADKDEKK